MTGALAIPDSIALDQASDPAQYVELACQRAKEWLAIAIEHGEIEQIVELKSQAEAIRIYTQQKQLGKDAELSAAEIVRRAERGIGVAIRRGQEAGEISRRERHGDHDANSISPHVAAQARSRSELSEHYYPVTDGVSDEAFASVMASSKGDQQIQCWTYLALHAFPKFRVAVTAGRLAETDIDRIVRTQGMVISQDAVPHAISAVGTLGKVYSRSDPATTARTIRIIRDGLGDPGFVAPVIDGIGLLCQRYNGQLDEADAIEALAKLHGGVNALLAKAETIRRSTGKQKNNSVAAAVVDIINGRTKGRGKKLPSWWKS